MDTKNMDRYYTGIGSRETPPDILVIMTNIARALSHQYICRTGGAQGADQAFEAGCTGRCNVFLPWPSFGCADQSNVYMTSPSAEAFEIAEVFHPRWPYISRGARTLHARNSHQILGPQLNDPVDFVICWTKDGKFSGGTGQALRIADSYRIPIWNLKKEDDLVYVKEELARMAG